MESDDDFELLSPAEEPSPSVRERKLKRLKKAIKVSSEPSSPLLEFSKSESLDSEGSNGRDSEVLDESLQSRAGLGSEEGLDGGNELDFGFDDGLGGEEEDDSGVKTKRVLEFDSVAEEFDENREDRSEEMGDEVGDLRMEEPEKKRRSSDEFDEDKDKKKKKKKKRGDESAVDHDGKPQENPIATTKRMTQKVSLSLFFFFFFVFVSSNL